MSCDASYDAHVKPMIKTSLFRMFMFIVPFLPCIVGVAGGFCDRIHLSTGLPWFAGPRFVNFRGRPQATELRRKQEDKNG